MIATDAGDAACQIRALLDTQAVRNRWWTGAIASSALLNAVLVAVVVGAVVHSAAAVFVVLLTFATCSFAVWWRLQSVPYVEVPIDVEDEKLMAAREMADRLAHQVGIAPPQVFATAEKSLNAGATGTRDHSYIRYTRGILNHLSPEELEAVTAHEIAHIANGDTRVVAFSSAVVAWVLYVALACGALIALGFSVGKLVADNVEDPRTNLLYWPWWLIVRITLFFFTAFLFLLLIVWFGIAFLTHLAFMRQREWLADATAARITDNPEVLCDALDQLDHAPTRLSQGGRWAQESAIAGAGASGRWWRDLLETHPHLQRRIARLRGAIAGVPERSPLTWGAAAPATACALAVLALGGVVTATTLQWAGAGTEAGRTFDGQDGQPAPTVPDVPPDTPTGTATATPTVVGLVDISQVSDDPRATAVATMFDTYFSGVNDRDYARALSVYDPASGVDPANAGTVKRFGEAVSTSSDADVVVQSIERAGDARTRTMATLTFRSTQSPGYGPKNSPDETCTLWTVTYELTRPAGEYRIRGAESEHESC
ncbi:M48 family metalloprotease [Streptomyces sp. PmtG]